MISTVPPPLGLPPNGPSESMSPVGWMAMAQMMARAEDIERKEVLSNVWHIT